MFCKQVRRALFLKGSFFALKNWVKLGEGFVLIGSEVSSTVRAASLLLAAASVDTLRTLGRQGRLL